MLPHHIVLTGAMGVGKTTLGFALADRLGVPFVDSDERLVAEHHQTGRQIAEAHGVAHLHRLEHDLVRKGIASAEPTVFAAAASVADDTALLGAIIAAGCSLVYLEADPTDLVVRSDTGTHRRPIDPAKSSELTEARRQTALAAGATLLSNGNDKTPQRLVVELMEMGGG